MGAVGIIILIVLILVAGIAVFHLVHYLVYCRYRDVPEKSHCAACGHQNVCKKRHQSK